MENENNYELSIEKEINRKPKYQSSADIVTKLATAGFKYINTPKHCTKKKKRRKKK